MSSVITGCAITPSSIVQQPTTAKAHAPNSSASNNGAIFNVASYRPTFEDRRPRFIGDIITINIVENTRATKAAESSAAKEGSASFNTDTTIDETANKINLPIIGGVLKSLTSRIPFADKTTMAATSDNSYTDNASANASNVFTGSITATVVDVLPNGNLMVSGEKQIAFDKGTEFVRFSGVINPDLVAQGNTIASTRVADARIEYRTNSKVDAASIASVFARFFLSMSPW
ncbi:MAG: flagellar basal body L-ring protein FlgH [Methylotenera sp.]|nr:flagellar basal body L-ring protein FlgH [Methylotenera sp.]